MWLWGFGRRIGNEQAQHFDESVHRAARVDRTHQPEPDAEGHQDGGGIAAGHSTPYQKGGGLLRSVMRGLLSLRSAWMRAAR
ncbi:hypothetical protein, partial [Mycolicibacterium agri]|uniref:hypothetical protein n=1 Tax=Mycolicibacterium agri TaxID=36811 RepID=UPI001A9C3234